LPVRLKNRFGGKPLGEVEEAFAATLTAGETFLIGGEVVRYEELREMTVVVTRDAKRKPRIAVFSGTKFSTSTLLNQRVMRLMKAENRSRLPQHTAQWLDLQQSISKIPTPDRMLVESYPLEGREFTCFYGFAGRNAMQTLGLMLTQKMEASQLYPMGFVASDYILMTWGLKEVSNPAELLDKQTLSDGFDNWLAGNAVMKRTFRDVATIAGLIDRNLPGRRKSGRQATFSTDILYDTIRKHDPEHLMMKITHEEAQRGLVDYGRIEEMLDQFGGKIDHVRPGQITPLSAPLHLEVGKVPIKGQAEDQLILKAAEDVLSLSKSKRQAAP
jgi:ATP-dependent Lhr-like helicase